MSYHGPRTTPAVCDESVTGEHLFVNYGLLSDPVSGCFACGCTPDDPTPDSVIAAVRAARIARTGI